MKKSLWAMALVLVLLISSAAMAETKLTIATVNNGDMIRMQGLTNEFTAKHPDIVVDWVILEENMLRQKVTTDIATKGGQFDIMTIGTYEVPIWAKKNWLVPLEDLGPDYDVDDILPPVRNAVSMDGKLYAAPFYGESTMVMYRKDLFEKAGIKMPKQPNWGFIYDAARQIHDPDNGVYGICLRGKAGWGENMAFLSMLTNSFGGRWFNEEWEPELDSPAWNHAISFYVDLLNNYGPPGASSNGFNENLALFNSGRCGMWTDATVAAAFVTNPKESKVADQVGFALSPCGITCRGANWLWAWNLAIPAGSKKVDAAKTFIEWATSKEYLELVASKEGWANVPPGTRISLYKNPKYLEAAPFAEITLDSMMSADPITGTMRPKPYIGVQYVAIPEFQGLGTVVGQQISSALAGKQSVDKALENSQQSATREMRRGGYIH